MTNTSTKREVSLIFKHIRLGKFTKDDIWKLARHGEWFRKLAEKWVADQSRQKSELPWWARNYKEEER